MAKQNSVVVLMFAMMSLGVIERVAAGGGMEFEPDENAEVSTVTFLP